MKIDTRARVLFSSTVVDRRSWSEVSNGEWVGKCVFSKAMCASKDEGDVCLSKGMRVLADRNIRAFVAPRSQ